MTPESAVELLKNISRLKLDLPVSNREINLSAITTKQLKDVAVKSTDLAGFNCGFVSAVFDVIRENSDVDVSDVTEQELVYIAAWLAGKKADIEKVKAIEEKTTDIKGIVVVCSTPDYIKCKKWIDAVESALKKEGTDEERGGEVFVLELCKYISSITINGEEVPVEPSVVSELPYANIVEVLSMIEDMKLIVTDILTIDGETQNFDLSLFL